MMSLGQNGGTVKARLKSRSSSCLFFFFFCPGLTVVVAIMQVKFPPSRFLPENKLTKLAKLLPAPTNEEPMDVDGLQEVILFSYNLYKLMGGCPMNSANLSLFFLTRPFYWSK